MPIFARCLLALAALAGYATFSGAQAADWPETVLWDFAPPGNTGDQFGYRPQMGVLAQGNVLYGSASAGGANGGGVIYKRANGAMHVLFRFTDQDTTTNGCGYNPSARLVVKSGKVYGTTYQGGIDDGGVIFELANTSGTWVCTPIWKFRKNPSDATQRGYASFGGLTPDPSAADTFYGTAQFTKKTKDSSGVKIQTGGVVFKLVKTGANWNYTVLKEFMPNVARNGLVPTGPLFLNAAGDTLYGATFFGGFNDGGVVYSIGTDGAGFKVLHRFNGDTTTNDAKSGYRPTQGPLAVDSAGVVYGATLSGGTTNIADPAAGDLLDGGVVFRLSPSGTLKLLYSFDNVNAPENGYGPIGGLTMPSDGFLYGNTQFGGAASVGSVFRLTGANKDKFHLLYDFPDTGLGAQPSGPVSVDSAGNITGTTLFGGALGGGVIFQLTKP